MQAEVVIVSSKLDFVRHMRIGNNLYVNPSHFFGPCYFDKSGNMFVAEHDLKCEDGEILLTEHLMPHEAWLSQYEANKARLDS